MSKSINYGDDYQIAQRLKSTLGVPSILLDDEDIVSPEYKLKAKRYIDKQINSIKDIIDKADEEMIRVSYTYYLAYLICPSMPLRMPQRMENISTKTILQEIDWYQLGQEMLNRCNDILNDLLEEYGEELTLGYTMIDLSDSSPYPNELV